MKEFESMNVERLEWLKENLKDVEVYRNLYDERGDHPVNHSDYSCAFVADWLRKFNPVSILDIGSFRLFVHGLLAHYKVTSLDVRDRAPTSALEVVKTGDAKSIPCGDESYDAVTSLCVIHHMGLGRYGDEFDLDADKKAVKEIIRVLKPGGHFIFSTTITTRKLPAIVFNAHRIYRLQDIHELCRGLKLVEERFYSTRLQNFVKLGYITHTGKIWDVYCGCWRKPDAAP